ncbi:MAG: hypothetical protein ACRDGQ_11530, partial [Candidatus Limnocylindrales bacterium]
MPDSATLMPALVLGLLVCLVCLVALWRQVVTLRRHLDGITRGEDGPSLQGVLETHLGRVVSAQAEVVELS